MRAPGATLFAAAAAAAAALAVGASGGDDEQADTGAIGAQGATGFEIERATEITAEEFLVMLLPEKKALLKGIAHIEPECEGLKVETSFVLVVSAAAADADPDAPLTELVTEEC